MDIFGGVMCVPYTTGRYLNRTAALLGGKCFKSFQKFYQKYYETLR